MMNEINRFEVGKKDFSKVLNQEDPLFLKAVLEKGIEKLGPQEEFDVVKRVFGMKRFIFNNRNLFLELLFQYDFDPNLIVDGRTLLLGAFELYDSELVLGNIFSLIICGCDPFRKICLDGRKVSILEYYRNSYLSRFVLETVFGFGDDWGFNLIALNCTNKKVFDYYVGLGLDPDSSITVTNTAKAVAAKMKNQLPLYYGRTYRQMYESGNKNRVQAIIDVLTEFGLMS